MNLQELLTPKVHVLLQKGATAAKSVVAAAVTHAATVVETIRKETSPEALSDRLFTRRMEHLRKGGLTAKEARKAILNRTEADLKRLTRKDRQLKEV